MSDFSLRGNSSFQIAGVGVVELDITIGAVDEGMEGALKVDGMVTARDSEIRNVDGAARLDMTEHSLKMIVGR